MSSLTEEGPNDLAEELHKRGPTGDNVNVEDGNGDWETWTPDPIETAVSSKSKYFCKLFKTHVLSSF